MAPVLNETPRETPDLPHSASSRRTVSNSSRTSSTHSQAPESVIKRLQQELLGLMLSKDKTLSAFPTSPSNLLHWTGTLLGPDETPYAGLTLKLTFSFPSNYPFAPPEVLFTTPIYHPNIDFSGRICLDILKDKWSSAMDVGCVLRSLQSLLGEPNCSSPLNGEAAGLWESDRVEYDRKVKERHRDVGE